MVTEKLNYLALFKARNVLQGAGMDKAAFVPMPGGQAEPVAGASPMTAALGAPMGAPGGAPPPGGPPPQAGGAPPMGGPLPGGPPPQAGGAPPPGGPPQGPLPQAGGPPPDILQDPQILQILEQNGIVLDPQQGTFIDTQSGQPIPAEQVMAIVEQIMTEMQSQAPQQGAPPEPSAPPLPPPPEQPEVPPEILAAIKDTVKTGFDQLAVNLDKAVTSSVATALAQQGGAGQEDQHMIGKYEADLKGIQDQLTDLQGAVQQLAETLEGNIFGGSVQTNS